MTEPTAPRSATFPERAIVAPAARAVGVVKRYGGGDNAVTALDQVSLDIPRASFTAVMGPSGSGKSTLLHCLAGLDTVSGGEIWIGDTELTSLPERRLTRLRRDRIGFVFQAYNLLPALNAAVNITLPLDIAGRRADRDWYDTVIGVVGLQRRLSHRPSELSGGQQQRVAVARALVTRPEIVFADEPTGNLDSRASAEILDLLRRSVREFGQTVAMVTHDPVAASYTDQVVFLADGRVVGDLQRPTPERVLDFMKQLGG
jgi:putative ABC transport system ATP-binding protein